MIDDLNHIAATCDNTGRWGHSDMAGTLNLISAAKRIAAAGLVSEGLVVPIGKPIDTVQSRSNPRPAWHQMNLDTDRPYASADSLHVMTHGFGATHIDALGHMSLDGLLYNGRRHADAVTGAGLTFAGVEAAAEGIFTRGLLLDVAAARRVPWLNPDDVVSASDLDAACQAAGILPEPGDAIIVHVGLEAREAEQGPEDPEQRAGLDLSSVRWLREHDAAVYSGDCIEAMPESSDQLPMPLHQIGLARMGLHLIDCPTLSILVATCHKLGRFEFLVVAAPLLIRGGTGSLVNPLAIF